MEVIKSNKVIPNTGRIRDEKEIEGYYTALDFYVEKLAQNKVSITEQNIKQIHILVVGGGNIKVQKYVKRFTNK